MTVFRGHVDGYFGSFLSLDDLIIAPEDRERVIALFRKKAERKVAEATANLVKVAGELAAIK
jgi:hypothetical protein